MIKRSNPQFSAFVRMASHRFTSALLIVCGAAFWLNTINDSAQTQKSHNTLFRGILFSINDSDNPQITSLPGHKAGFVCSDARLVKGYANIIKGTADLTFRIASKDSESAAECAEVSFRGSRVKGKDSWVSDSFVITPVVGGSLQAEGAINL